MVNLDKIVRIRWEGETGSCIEIIDVGGGEAEICYPMISEGLFRKGDTRILELHRFEGRQEIQIEFDKPKKCRILGSTLVCGDEI